MHIARSIRVRVEIVLLLSVQQACAYYENHIMGFVFVLCLEFDRKSVGNVQLWIASSTTERKRVYNFDMGS